MFASIRLFPMCVWKEAHSVSHVPACCTVGRRLRTPTFSHRLAEQKVRQS